jgi:hypothetical protein
MHCHILSVSIAVVLTLIFAIGLEETTPPCRMDSWWKVFISSLFYLFWAGMIITVYCYGCVFSSWSQSPHPVTYVCILLRQEVLSLGLCFSMLTIPVQALSLGHALTTIPCIQCVPMVISMSVSTPPTALGNNGWRSQDLTVLSGEELGTSFTVPRYSILINQYQCFLVYVQP